MRRLVTILAVIAVLALASIGLLRFAVTPARTPLVMTSCYVTNTPAGRTLCFSLSNQCSVPLRLSLPRCEFLRAPPYATGSESGLESTSLGVVRPPTSLGPHSSATWEIADPGFQITWRVILPYSPQDNWTRLVRHLEKWGVAQVLPRKLRTQTERHRTCGPWFPPEIHPPNQPVSG
jgi:hypothetical protein